MTPKQARKFVKKNNLITIRTKRGGRILLDNNSNFIAVVRRGKPRKARV